MTDSAVYRTLLLASWCAVVAIVALQVAIASTVAKREGLGLTGKIAVAVGAFFFMPITLAFSLGQAQIFLDLFLLC